MRHLTTYVGYSWNVLSENDDEREREKRDEVITFHAVTVRKQHELKMGTRSSFCLHVVIYDLKWMHVFVSILHTSIELARWPSHGVTPFLSLVSPPGFKRYCRASSCNSDHFSSRSDHCRVIPGMSYKGKKNTIQDDRWGKRIALLFTPLGTFFFFYLLCRATDRRRRRRIAPRVVVAYTIGRKGRERERGLRSNAKGMKEPWENRTYR
jgi:hypothetical protein